MSLINNRQYDTLDRSDENMSNSLENNYINITQFKKCSLGKEAGVTCGKKCIKHGFWCTSDIRIGRGKSNQVCGDENVSRDDKQLCGNPLVWKNISCSNYNYEGALRRYGMRCNGTYQTCVTPWYNVVDGDEDVTTNTLPSCQDKSDQIFPIGQTCASILKQKIRLLVNML